MAHDAGEDHCSQPSALLATLGPLSADVLAVDASDKDAIVGIGAKLEEALDQTPEAFHDVSDLLTAALLALQAVYQEDVPDGSQVISAIAAAIQAAYDRVSDGADSQAVADAKAAMLQATTAEQRSDEGGGAEPADDESVAAEQGAADGPPEQVEFPGPAVMPDDLDAAILAEFGVECLEHITNAEAALLELENNPEDVDHIGVVFRAFHTIKGTSGFLNLDRIQRLAHLAENLLDRVRENAIRIAGGYADLALKSCDGLRTMIEGLEGVEVGQDLVLPEDLDELLLHLSAPEYFGFSEEAHVDMPRVGDILVASGAVNRDTVEEAVERQGARPLGEELVREGAARPAEVAQALRVQKKISGDTKAEATARVGLSRLDGMINMVGELVIAHSMVAQDPHITEDPSGNTSRKVSHAGKIIRELQDETMGLRMVPLRSTFQKMTRLVRDLSRKSGKQVRFVTDGEDTEIDRNMVEALNDPLVHMIRNSCDHGIETPNERAEVGKDPTGTVTLRAFHSAGNVVIQLEDDGKGLDREKIVAKAIERGLIDSGKDLSDSEAFQLIFRPGFSTAEKVTDVSGRGVGMDVVKKSIDSLRGRIDVESTPGKGTVMSLRLPLTMAITDAMLVRVGEDRYLLPTISIEQSFRPTPEMLSTVTGKGEVVLLRGELLPVFRLHKLFRVSGAREKIEDGLLIVIEGEGKRCALMVDVLLGQQQVVIKSLGAMLGSVPGVSGGAILGDGRVGLILDAAGLVEVAHQRDDEVAADKAGVADPAGVA
jgi:two-component system chemotaxis sensor kinase CheA